MSRPRREHVVAFALAGTALALVGGICGYFGTAFGYHLWSAERCATASRLLDEAPWWVRAAGALVGSVAYAGLGLLAGLPFRSTVAESASLPIPPGWAERVAAALTHVGLWLGLPFIAAGVMVLVWFPRHTVPAPAWCRRASSAAVAGAAAGPHPVPVLPHPRHLHRRRAGGIARREAPTVSGPGHGRANG